MDLLVIRHAIAREPTNNTPDEERTLTDEGRREMHSVARRLREALPDLDAVASSPLIRARQTAEIVCEAYQLDFAVVDALGPGGSREALLEWLRGRSEEHVAVVGHAPDLDELITWFATGSTGPWIALRKGGVCLLKFPGKPEPGRAEIRWMLTPKLLRRLTT